MNASQLARCSRRPPQGCGILLLAEISYGGFQFSVSEVCVDFRGANPSVSECLLDEPQVTRLLVEPSRERVTECVDRAATSDPR